MKHPVAIATLIASTATLVACSSIGIGVSIPIGRSGSVGVGVGSDGRISGGVAVGSGGGGIVVGGTAQLPARAEPAASAASASK